MAMTIQELREKRKKAWDTARDFLDSKRNANGVLSEEGAHERFNLVHCRDEEVS